MPKMMGIETEASVGASKGKHTPDRATYSSGVWIRRINTGLGTVDPLVSKVRKGRYVPFFILERRWSEQPPDRGCP
jgi:putative transposase